MENNVWYKNSLPLEDVSTIHRPHAARPRGGAGGPGGGGGGGGGGVLHTALVNIGVKKVSFPARARNLSRASWQKKGVWASEQRGDRAPRRGGTARTLGVWNMEMQMG